LLGRGHKLAFRLHRSYLAIGMKSRPTDRRFYIERIGQHMLLKIPFGGKMFVYRKIIVGILSLALLAIGISACSSQPTTITIAPLPTATNSSPAQETYSDPFAYCAAIGTIDTPDARYTGPHITDAIINGFKTAAGLESSTEPMEMFQKTTIWRCMDHQVYACNFGANLPCDSKANTDKTPTQAMGDYCKVNPDSDFIPMSVTGHATIYSWHCVKDTPELLNQIAKVDAAGYLANIWRQARHQTADHRTQDLTP
jgi:hypothetical protein